MQRYLVATPQLQVKAFGLNRMDILQREGKYPPPPGSSTILGVEFSGTICEIGSSVTDWKVGDEVLGLAGGVGPHHFLMYHRSTRRLNPSHIIREPMRNTLQSIRLISYQSRLI